MLRAPLRRPQVQTVPARPGRRGSGPSPEQTVGAPGGLGGGGLGRISSPSGSGEPGPLPPLRPTACGSPVAPGQRSPSLPPSGRPPRLGGGRGTPKLGAVARLSAGSGVRGAGGSWTSESSPNLPRFPVFPPTPAAEGEGYDPSVGVQAPSLFPWPPGRLWGHRDLPDPTLRPARVEAARSGRRSAGAAPPHPLVAGHPHAPPGKTATSPPPRTPRPAVPVGPHPAGGTHAHRFWLEPPSVSVARLLRPPQLPTRLSTCRSVCPGAGAPYSVGARECHGFPAQAPCDQLAAVFVPGAEYPR